MSIKDIELVFMTSPEEDEELRAERAEKEERDAEGLVESWIEE